MAKRDSSVDWFNSRYHNVEATPYWILQRAIDHLWEEHQEKVDSAPSGGLCSSMLLDKGDLAADRLLQKAAAHV